LAGDAAPLLLAAAKRLEELDLGLARETYLSACAAPVSVTPSAPTAGEIQRAQPPSVNGPAAQP
jgi:hypothetical protein